MIEVQKKLSALLEIPLPADERDAFDLSYTLDAPLRGDGQAYRFWVEEDAESFTELDATGPITPPNTDAFERGYRLFTDAPRGAVRVEMRLTLPAPTRTDYDMAELEAALAQAGNAMRRSMGLRALFMPRLDTVRFAFDGPAPEAVFVLDDGTTRSIDAVFSSDVLVTPAEDESDGAHAIRSQRTAIEPAGEGVDGEGSARAHWPGHACSHVIAFVDYPIRKLEHGSRRTDKSAAVVSGANSGGHPADLPAVTCDYTASAKDR